MTLRPYQESLVDELRSGFRSKIRAQCLQAPTGSGKTVLFSAMTLGAQQKGVQTLIVAHRSEILDQIGDTLTTFKVDFGHIRAGMTPDDSKLVQVASIQTLFRRIDKLTPPKLIIIDECHHSCAKQHAVLFNRWPDSQIVGVTATPQRLDGKGLDAYFQRLVLGPKVQWLMDQGYLKKATYYAPSTQLDLSGVKKLGGDYDKLALSAIMDKSSVTGDVVDHYKRLGNDQLAVGFAINLLHAEHLSNAFNEAGIRSEIIEGTLEREQRIAMKDRFSRGETRVLMSCELVSEGFDLPAVGCCILARPTASLGLHLQQIGRGLRPSQGSEKCVILDHAGNCLKHGLAEEERDWTLEGRAEKRRAPEDRDNTRQCKDCFAVFLGSVCPQCGWSQNEDTLTHAAGELAILTAGHKREKKMEEQQCRVFDDFVTLGKQRGYAKGWAWFRWKHSHFNKSKRAVAA